MSAEQDGTYVIVDMAGERYGLPVESVTGVIRYEDVTPVPRAAACVLGVINLRGTVIPVVDAQMAFCERPFVAGEASRIVVAESGTGAFGICVDAAREVATVSAEEVKPVPVGAVESSAARAFSGIVEREGDRLVILLDPEQIIPAADRRVGTEDAEEGAGSD